MRDQTIWPSLMMAGCKAEYPTWEVHIPWNEFQTAWVSPTCSTSSTTEDISDQTKKHTLWRQFGSFLQTNIAL